MKLARTSEMKILDELILKNNSKAYLVEQDLRSCVLYEGYINGKKVVQTKNNMNEAIADWSKVISKYMV